MIVIILAIGLVSCGSKYSNILDGTWYEQEENGSVLVISGNEITYEKNDMQYTSKFDTKETDKAIQIYPLSEDFVLEDLTYYFEDYSILGHMRTKAGANNFISVMYGKGVYISPEPVKGELIDNTDVDAPKSISDYHIKSLYFTFNNVASDSSEESDEPDRLTGRFEYALERDDDGEWLLSSLFCQDIIVSDEWVSSLGDIINELNVAAFNGFDKRIYMLSDEHPDYTIDIEFVSGESIYSSANGDFVTDAWYVVQNKLSDELFDAIINGGYDPNTDTFHTTQPIKRIGLSEEEQDSFGISTEEKRIEKDGKKYTYKNYVDYILFTGGDRSHSSLFETLNDINDQISSSAKEDLEYYFTIMEDVPAAERADVEDIYCYSFYQIDRLHSDEKLFWFRLSSGHSSNVLSQEYNTFSYNRYCFDPNTGKRVSPVQLFTNQDWFEADLIKRLLDVYKEGEVHNIIDSPEFRTSLHNMLTEPDIYGYVEWEPGYHFFTIYIPDDLISVLDYRVELQYYYDEYQQQLNDDYTATW